MNTTNSGAFLLALAGLVGAGCGANDPQAPADEGSGGSPGSAGDSITTSAGGSNGLAGSGNNAGSSTPATGGSGGGSAGTASTTDAMVGPVKEAGSGGDGAGNGGWVSIFNGKDLTGWYPLIKGQPYKTDTYETFHVDPATGVIKCSYEKYPGGNFDGKFGLLYYDKRLTNYRVRVTYHFLEPQSGNPPAWGKNNSGLMVFGIDPTTISGMPDFPPLIEIQLLGLGSSGGSTNPNICVPGGMTMKASTAGCGDNKTGVAPRPAAEWVTVEAEVHVNGDSKVFQYPEMAKPVITMSGPMYQGQAVTGGYLSLQSESQPCEFKNVELMELPQ